jgi:hypothetical protein
MSEAGEAKPRRADASRLPGGRHAERGMSRERKEAEA